MSKPKIYIDGQAGTTGLQIMDRLTRRDDVELLRIDNDRRHDNVERARLMNAADLVFLCLPDAAAVEAVTLVENPNTRIIDASTAHRTNPAWVYGFPELSPQRREAIQSAKRVANPGCHASGLIASVYPLVQAGILSPDYPLTCYSLTGYSGGGKKMIAEYEDEGRSGLLSSDRVYGTNLKHKHLPEMQAVCGLTRKPVFSPVVGDFPQGMATTILLHNDLLTGQPTAQDIWAALAAHYGRCPGHPMVRVAPFNGEGKPIFAGTLAGTDGMELIVSGGAEQTIVTALFDNLGKGASGAAVQNMNLMLGFDEDAGLV